MDDRPVNFTVVQFSLHSKGSKNFESLKLFPFNTLMKPLSVLIPTVPTASPPDAALAHQSNQTSLDTVAKDYPRY